MFYLDIFCHQMNHPVSGTACIQSSCWSEGPHGSPQTTQAFAKAAICFPQTDAKVLSLWSTFNCLVEGGEAELGLSKTFTPVDECSWY